MLKRIVDSNAFALVILLSCFAFMFYWVLVHPMKITSVQTTPEVRTVYVDRPVLTDKIIEKIITDPKDKALIAALMAENKSLSVRVTALSKTIAETQSHGGGIVEVSPIEREGVLIVGAAPEQMIHFKDWRLDFKTDGKTASYDLNQKFEVLATTGRDKDGKPVTLVKLFELGAKEERMPATKLTTVAIFADETKTHVILAPAVQAGLAFTSSARGAVVGVQWLKWGRTKAAEDGIYAFLTPVAFVAADAKEIGLLPASYNLGQLKRNPLNDIWLSPYIGIDLVGRKPSRLGFALTATF